MTTPQKQISQGYLIGASCPKNCIFCTLKTLLFSPYFPFHDETISIHLLWFLLHLVVKGSPNVYGCLFQLSSSQWCWKESLPAQSSMYKNYKQKTKAWEFYLCKALCSPECCWHCQNCVLLEAGLKMRAKSTLINELEEAVQSHCHFCSKAAQFFFQMSEWQAMTFQKQAKNYLS